MPTLLAVLGSLLLLGLGYLTWIVYRPHNNRIGKTTFSVRKLRKFNQLRTTDRVKWTADVMKTLGHNNWTYPKSEEPYSCIIGDSHLGEEAPSLYWRLFKRTSSPSKEQPPSNGTVFNSGDTSTMALRIGTPFSDFHEEVQRYTTDIRSRVDRAQVPNLIAIDVSKLTDAFSDDYVRLIIGVVPRLDITRGGHYCSCSTSVSHSYLPRFMRNAQYKRINSVPPELHKLMVSLIRLLNDGPTWPLFNGTALGQLIVKEGHERFHSRRYCPSDWARMTTNYYRKATDLNSPL